jgi:hypothetical protein
MSLPAEIDELILQLGASLVRRSDDGMLVYGATVVTERQPAVPDRTKIGDIFTRAEGDRLCAYWRGTADTIDTFLVSIDAAVCNDAPGLHDQFLQLVSAAATARAHGKPGGKTDLAAARFAQLPCAQCERPEAAEIRLRCGQVSDMSELDLSPLGPPAGCCRRRTVGNMMLDTPRPPAPPARRMGRRY